MARAKTPVLTDPKQREILDALCVDVEKALHGEFFEVDGTPTLTVKYQDGTYKKKPVANLELTLVGIYVGARGTPIFVFSPEDAQEWEYAEMDAKQLDQVIPLFGSKLAEKHGLRDEELGKVFDRLLLERQLTASAEIEKAEAAAVAGYDTNPNFGRF